MTALDKARIKVVRGDITRLHVGHGGGIRPHAQDPVARDVRGVAMRDDSAQREVDPCFFPIEVSGVFR